MAMQAEAQRTFCARHGECPPERSPAMDALSERMEKARDEFEAYRIIARAIFPSMPDRINLRATAEPLEDLQRFINAAHAGYVTASQEPYAEKFAKRGYPAARLEALLREIDVLATLDTAHGIAEADGAADDGSEAADTQDRDRTYRELKEFMKEIKAVCKALFRKDPDDAGVVGVVGLGVGCRDSCEIETQGDRGCHHSSVILSGSESASESPTRTHPARRAAKRGVQIRTS